MEDRDRSPSRRKRWLGLLLVVSLGLNLLIVGAAVGVLVKWPRDHFVRGGYFLGPAGLGAISGALDERHGKLVGDALRDKGRTFGQLRSEARTNVSSLVRILRSDPFDPAELEGYFRDERARAAGMLEEGHDLILPRILDMSSQERHEFADRIEHRFDRRDRRGH